MNINIYEIMRLLGIETIYDFITLIKLQGEPLENTYGILELPNNKFIERVIIFFQDVFYVTYIVSDTFEEIVYWDEIEGFEHEWQARDYYNDLNGKIYE